MTEETKKQEALAIRGDRGALLCLGGGLASILIGVSIFYKYSPSHESYQQADSHYRYIQAVQTLSGLEKEALGTESKLYSLLKEYVTDPMRKQEADKFEAIQRERDRSFMKMMGLFLASASVFGIGCLIVGAADRKRYKIKVEE